MVVTWLVIGIHALLKAVRSINHVVPGVIIPLAASLCCVAGNS